MALEARVARLLDGDARRVLIEFQGRPFDRSWLSRVARSVEGRLGRAGLGPNDIIAFAPRNRPASAAALLGLLAAHRTIVMLYPFRSPASLAAEIRGLAASAIILDEADAAPEVVTACQDAAVACLALGVDGRVERCGSLGPPLQRHASDGPPAVRVLTSGTTGRPKHFDLSYPLIESMTASNVTLADAAVRPIEPPALHFFPFANISGLYGFLPPLLSGRAVVLLEKFTVGHWLDYVERYRPVRGYLPPAGIRMVLDAAVAPARLRGIEAIGTGSAPLDPVTHRAFEQRYRIPILQTYGATEFGGPVATMTLDDHQRYGDAKFGSVGRAWDGADLRIVDPRSGETVARGCDGLLEVRVPRMGPGWIRTTDLARLDDDGFLFLRGRADGAIVRGGFKVLPASIEDALMRHPGVAAVAVVALPDPRLGAVPGVAVEARAGRAPPSEAELIDRIRAECTALHVPGAIRVLANLPRTPSLKVDLGAVRELLVGGREAPRSTPS